MLSGWGGGGAHCSWERERRGRGREREEEPPPRVGQEMENGDPTLPPDSSHPFLHEHCDPSPFIVANSQLKHST